jgi:hypothetical protein
VQEQYGRQFGRPGLILAPAGGLILQRHPV